MEAGRAAEARAWFVSSRPFRAAAGRVHGAIDLTGVASGQGIRTQFQPKSSSCWPFLSFPPAARNNCQFSSAGQRRQRQPRWLPGAGDEGPDEMPPNKPSDRGQFPKPRMGTSELAVPVNNVFRQGCRVVVQEGRVVLQRRRSPRPPPGTASPIGVPRLLAVTQFDDGRRSPDADLDQVLPKTISADQSRELSSIPHSGLIRTLFWKALGGSD